MSSINVIPHGSRERAELTDFLIRDLDAALLEGLRRRALANGRSLQAEIHQVLKQSVRLSRDASVALIEELQARTSARGLGDSTTLIREERDAR